MRRDGAGGRGGRGRDRRGRGAGAGGFYGGGGGDDDGFDAGGGGGGEELQPRLCYYEPTEAAASAAGWVPPALRARMEEDPTYFHGMDGMALRWSEPSAPPSENLAVREVLRNTLDRQRRRGAGVDGRQGGRGWDGRVVIAVPKAEGRAAAIRTPTDTLNADIAMPKNSSVDELRSLFGMPKDWVYGVKPSNPPTAQSTPLERENFVRAMDLGFPKGTKAYTVSNGEQARRITFIFPDGTRKTSYKAAAEFAGVVLPMR